VRHCPPITVATVLLIMATPAFSQSKKILGFVRDSVTYRPIEGAEVSAGAAGRDKVSTDDEGLFNLPLLDSVGPTVRLSVQAQGHKSADLLLAVTADRVYPISLTPSQKSTATRASANDASYVAPESFTDALRSDANAAFESMQARTKAGIESFFDLVIAHDEVIRVELALTTNTAQQIAVYEAALDVARKLEADAQSRYSAGVVPIDAVYLTRLHRSEVDLMLAKLRSHSR
jgi:outer membrane protein TolC